MRLFFRFILALVLVMPPLEAQSAAPPATPPAWPVATAPARFVIEPIAPGSAILSEVGLFLPDPNWEKLPIRVFTDTGVAVGSDLVWTDPGDPITLIFDSSSGAKHYQVYLGSNWPALHVPDTHAGVWVETRGGDGHLYDQMPDMLAAWKKSTDIRGRVVVQGICEGGNRFGPQDNIFIHLQGWFGLDKPGHYDFAPISVHSSFVLVDGKEVIKWTGPHDNGFPPSGPPQGSADLAAGIHVLDYYNTYASSPGGRPPVFAGLAIRGGAFPSWTFLSPSNSFIRPVMFDRTTGYDLQAVPAGPAPSSTVPLLAITWGTKSASEINTDEPDFGLIDMEFQCYSPVKGRVVWTFDDGMTAEGETVEHLFPRTGQRFVHVTILDGEKPLATFTRTVRIIPDWSHVNGAPPSVDPKHEKDIMGRDPNAFSSSDLAGVYAVFGAHEKGDDLLRLLPAMCAKMEGVKETDLPYLRDSAMYLVRQHPTHFTEEIALLRALLDRATQGTPAPPSVVVASQCRLVLAQLLLKTSNGTDEVRALLDAINLPSLSNREPRALDVLRGDLALATGDVDAARKKYQDLTVEPTGPDVRSSIRRTAKIGQARVYIDRKDYEAAQDALREVTWQAPIEKLSPDWALTQLRLYEEQPEMMPAAYWLGHRLLPVLSANGRSELLYRMAEIAFAQHDDDLAKNSLSELLAKHPYSEEAARAKEKWPGVGEKTP